MHLQAIYLVQVVGNLGKNDDEVVYSKKWKMHNHDYNISGQLGIAMHMQIVEGLGGANRAIGHRKRQLVEVRIAKAQKKGLPRHLISSPPL